MSVFIRDIHKPESCAVCFMSNDPKDELYCPFSKIESLDNYMDFHCPIWEVDTPHGRLVDADNIPPSNYIGEIPVFDAIALSCVPTVIEAEGE